MVLVGGVWMMIRYVERAGAGLDAGGGRRRGRQRSRRARGRGRVERVDRPGEIGEALRPAADGPHVAMNAYADGELVWRADLGVYADAAPRLRLQVVGGAYELVDPGALVTWEVAAGLRTVLVLDLPDGETNVHPAQLARWGVAGDDLRETALWNSFNSLYDVAEARLVDPALGLIAELTTSPSHYAAAAGLKVLERLRGAGPDLVFALPSWSDVLIRPLDESATRAGLEKLAALVAARYDEAPRPGVRGVYWQRDDGIVPVSFAARDGGFTLVGPAALLARLA